MFTTGALQKLPWEMNGSFKLERANKQAAFVGLVNNGSREAVIRPDSG
jgi:hypothetical protein